MEIASVPYKGVNEGSNILKANYHLNYGKRRVAQAIKKGNKFNPLAECVNDIFKGGFDKSYFVDNEEKAHPYISAQHMVRRLAIESGKLISKALTTNYQEMSLKDKQVLISCAGTIGNTRLIGKDLDGVLGSQDIIRIVTDDESYGFVYAYLSSNTAYNFIQSYIYGSVVPRIEPKMLGTLPVPEFEKELKDKINSLIIQVKKLREEAYEHLKTSHKLFDEVLKNAESRPFYKVARSCNLFNYQSRLDASLNIEFEYFNNILRRNFQNIDSMGEHISNAFIPNRGKRLYVKNGLKYLSTSDISTTNPGLIEKEISNNTPGISTIPVEKDWLLIARSGQEILGSCFYVSETLDGLGVNEHALRVILKDSISPKYVYAFLSSKFGKQYLRSGIFGSAILTINEDFLHEMKIPRLNEIDEVKVIDQIEKSIQKFDLADQTEKEAIDLVEKEIESWQK